LKENKASFFVLNYSTVGCSELNRKKKKF